MTQHALITVDGLRLKRWTWPSSTAERGIVVIAHGYAEHAGRYAWLASRLNAGGYRVESIDARGHGESEGERVYLPSIDVLAGDLGALCDELLQEDRSRVFVLGHSLGSLVALKTVARRQPGIAGLVLSGNALDGRRSLPAPAIALLRLFSRICPHLRLVPALRAEDISTDATVVSDYRRDPLVDHGRWRVATAAAVMQGIAECRALLPGIRIPLYLLHGAEDKMLSPEGARFALEAAGSTDKSLKIYAGEYHETMSGLDKDRVVSDLLAWLDRRSG